MKIKSFIIGAMALLGCATVQANDCMSCNPCNPCDPCDSFCDGWSVYGDWLFWKVRRSGLDYTIEGDNFESPRHEYDSNTYVPFGKMHCVDPEYQSGYRIGFAKNFCELDVGVRYTHFKADHTNSKYSEDYSLDGTRQHPLDDEAYTSSWGSSSINDFDYAESGYSLKLDQIDVEAGKAWDTCEGLRVRPFVGFRYARIDQHMNTFYDIEDGLTVSEFLDIKAYGFYLGAGVRYTFCECFGLHACLSGGLYIASTSGHHNEGSGFFGNGSSSSSDSSSGSGSGSGDNVGSVPEADSDIHVSRCDSDILVGSCDAAFGVSYELHNCFCGNWMFAAGYEFHNWSGMPDFLNFTDDGSFGNHSRNHSNLGYDGLYVRVKMEF